MKLVKEISKNKYLAIDQAIYDAEPSLYIDRSDRPAYWIRHYADAGFTYWQSRYHIKELLDNSNGFSDFNKIDIDAFCDYAYGNRNEIVFHYMNEHGMDQATAQGLMALKMSEAVSLLSVDAKSICSSPKMNLVGIKYLTIVNEEGRIDSTQAYNLTEAIITVKKMYEDSAVLGLEYGDDHEGIMDYFEGTGNYVGGGLENYTLSANSIAAYGSEANALAAMRSELVNLFVKGNI